MKTTTALAFLLHATTILAVPVVSLQEETIVAGLSSASDSPSDGSTDAPEGPPAWRLDCGSPGVTALCSAVNGGAHCDPITGALTITLEGTCGGCKCLSADQCTGRCG